MDSLTKIREEKKRLEEDLIMLVQNRINEFYKDVPISIENIYISADKVTTFGEKHPLSVINVRIDLEDI
jgi:hypothetical protein